ncbi:MULTISPECIES: bifunctional nicotinamidase/pyrazinamidase [unclassified Bosea (in: a-proteobacteria)]|uniref:bifunctional nicotinamidase/pyrazinamidase n=1 Tax=unclassified Bosea (in: a-proteobacteria) TaxID=2653178 RepID=UPI000F75F434|nr:MULTISPECIES: bifunctional nicotinamidase/pyrazinamidase [unclassified Bosea (in: a-proteobacteria)]AZO77147.1 nicotinamidase [Bosea sp. Tri-49]RXT21996.1 nicotinamidase [Bosea sp. Tri-39]RXT32336.1 nicotinamidase [Bosea sp. Tri-54]
MIDAQTALIVVDVQNDFCPGGSLAVAGGDEIVPLVNELGRRFATAVLTQDWHPAGHSSFASSHPGHKPFETVAMPYGTQVLWPDHCVQGSAGAAFHPGLDLAMAQAVIRKGCRREVDSYSGFVEADRTTPTGLGGYLRERAIARVVVVGLATDFCVNWTAQDAARHGFETIVVEEACRAIDLDGSLDRAWAEMAALGVRRAGLADLSG